MSYKIFLYKCIQYECIIDKINSKEFNNEFLKFVEKTNVGNGKKL